MITIQYLEEAPDLEQLDIDWVIERLHQAYQRLPFSHLLIGWRLPPRLLEACRKEAERLGVRFLRWHPLLTSDGVFYPRPEWRVVGLSGESVKGFQGMPEFTFVCPNQPNVREAILEHIEDLLQEGIYQGFFLDRIRFPSPAANPVQELGCFCEYCLRKAVDSQLDLAAIRQALLRLTTSERGHKMLVLGLLDWDNPALDDDYSRLFRGLFLFRSQSVTELIRLVHQQLRDFRLEIGLDCFSSCLTTMVGQDLSRLSDFSDWIKVMSYAHTLGPAGLPFEFLGMYNYLTSMTNLSEAEALQWLSEAASLPLPTSRRALETWGLPPQALMVEAHRAVENSHVPILVGLELVEIEGVAHLNMEQIAADLDALRRTGVAGLALSWDLRFMPLERLDLVRQRQIGL